MQGGLLSSIQVGTAGSPDAHLKLGYSYDVFGNIATLTEGTTPNGLTYDAENRLTGAFTKSYSYWPTGRFYPFEGITFTYGTGAGGPITSRRLSTGGATQTMGWTPANELRTLSTNGVLSESYRYDPDGERIVRSVAGGPVQYVYFPHYETSVQNNVTTVTKSYFFGGQRVAQKVGSGALTWLHGDHLGSTVLTTGVAGSKKYHAYGATRTGSVPTEWRSRPQPLAPL